MTAQTPVFGGLLPEQIRLLEAPISASAVYTHRYSPHPYVPGWEVIRRLNRFFGVDSWSLAILGLATNEVARTKTNAGDDAWVGIFTARVCLTIRTPGGRVFSKDGVGSAEQTSPNKIDVYANGQSSAVTNALKSAAINLGPQFGLAVMRAAKALDVNWKKLATDEDAVWPDLATLSQGLPAPVDEPTPIRVESVDDVVADANLGIETPKNEEPRRPEREPRREQERRDDAVAGAGRADHVSRRGDLPTGGQREQRRDEEPPRTGDRTGGDPFADNPADKPDPPREYTIAEKRKSYVDKAMKIWVEMGTDKARPIYDRVCKEFGDISVNYVRRDEDKGGPPNDFLVALVRLLTAEQ